MKPATPASDRGVDASTAVEGSNSPVALSAVATGESAVSGAVDALSASSLEPAITDPDDMLLQTMMSVCLSESVGAEYVPTIREVLDFASGDHQWSTPPRRDALAKKKVVIVGAGISGLALAIKR